MTLPSVQVHSLTTRPEPELRSGGPRSLTICSIVHVVEMRFAEAMSTCREPHVTIRRELVVLFVLVEQPGWRRKLTNVTTEMAVRTRPDGRRDALTVPAAAATAPPCSPRDP